MKKTMGTGILIVTLAVATALSTLAPAETPKKTDTMFDTKPGPAFMTVDGKLSKINGNIYIVEDLTGKELRL